MWCVFTELMTREGGRPEVEYILTVHYRKQSIGRDWEISAGARGVRKII